MIDAINFESKGYEHKTKGYERPENVNLLKWKIVKI